MDIHSTLRHTQRALAAVALATSLASLSGCVALVASWPAVGDDGAVNDPNVSPIPKVISAAVHEVVRRYPMPGEFVVNLPEGLVQSRAERIAAEISPNARIVSPETEHLPVYHVTKVWVRGDRAQVDVVRPLDEPQTWQRVTVHLRHHLDRGWTVEYVKVWPMGMATPGSLYGWLSKGAAGDPPDYSPGAAPTNTQDNSAPPPADNTQMEGIGADGATEMQLHQSIEVKEGGADGSGQ